jgi:citrate lyase subunit beta / citryl-CoA lyase
VTPRSFLFVPGDSEKKLGKAAGAGADALILDLEDAVAPARKHIAREMVREYLAANAAAGGAQRWVRMNPLAEGGLDDLVAVVRSAPDGIVVPKSDGPGDIVRIGHLLDALEKRDGVPKSIRLLPVATETAQAPFGLEAYRHAPSPRLYGLTWGAEDLSAALGASTNLGPGGDWAFTYRMVRSLTLLAAKAAGVEPIETLHADFRDEDGLRRSSIEASREGFTGRIAIHPAQVAIINEAFTPSVEEIAQAHRVRAAFAAAPGEGAVGLDGRMLDMPHLRQAEAVLARARLHGRTAP